MISIQAKKHDNSSVEFKVGFNCTENSITDEFSVNAWIFVPNSLDINPENYGKKQFYRDIKSNVRMITPIYLMSEIVQEDSLQLRSLRQAMDNVVHNPSQSDMDQYEYHLKMFAAIFKSSLRNHAAHLRSSDENISSEYFIKDYADTAALILKRFRALYRIINVPTVSDTIRNYFRYCDEFMSHVLEVQTVRIIRKIDFSPDAEQMSACRKILMGLIKEERRYKESRQYGIVNGELEHDRQLIYHRGMLKKFIESELYINLNKKKDGLAVEQLYYSIAAGVAMIFATAVAWLIQVRYGNITWPLFVALVVSYMMKDRIKDLMRYYFAHKLGNKYYDKKASITVGKKRVGEIKEGFDFITLSKTPQEVINLRNKASYVEDEYRIYEEKIMLYRKRVKIDDVALSSNDDYPMHGINDIIRLHMSRFTNKMDNSSVPVKTFEEDGNIETIDVQKIYFINMVFQLRHDDNCRYHCFKITMTKDGVLDVNEIF